MKEWRRVNADDDDDDDESDRKTIGRISRTEGNDADANLLARVQPFTIAEEAVMSLLRLLWTLLLIGWKMFAVVVVDGDGGVAGGEGSLDTDGGDEGVGAG